METLIQQIHHFFSAEMTVFIAAAIPVLELRGAIPVGLAFGLDWREVLLLSLFGSMLPVPLLFFAIRPVFRLLMRQDFFHKHISILIEKTLAKSKNIQRYEFWGLAIFVAIPLPGTGVWTGTLAAVLLDMRFRKALPALLIGDFGAGILVTAISAGALKVFGL
jgi:uncharacterized membrane protein